MQHRQVTWKNSDLKPDANGKASQQDTDPGEYDGTE
jgi:hypothetical protein